MTCEELNGLLDRLMDDELGDDEKRAMTAHAAECPQCAEAIRTTLQMKALFDEMEPELDVPLAAQAKWRGAVRREAEQNRKRKLTRWIGSAAAAVVVLVGVGLAVNGGLSPRDNAVSLKTAEVSETADEAIALGAEYDSAQEVDVIEVDGENATPMDANSEMDAGQMSTSAPLQPDAVLEMEPVEESSVGLAAEEEAMDPLYEAEASAFAAEEPLEPLDEAMVGDAMCAAVAQQAPAVELAIQVSDVEGVCTIVGDLAKDYDGFTDVQSVEGGSANVYVQLNASEAKDFLSTVAMLDATENAPDVPELPEDGQLLVLLVVNPAE